MTLLVTPFSGNEDYIFNPVKTYESGKDCSIKYIEKLYERKILDDIDMDIIDLLGYYTILNYSLISKKINQKVGIFISSKDEYFERLVKLRKRGIVLFYKKIKTEQGVYILSEGANIYYNLKKGSVRKRLGNVFKDKLDAATVNHIVSTNSLYINIHGNKNVNVKKHKIKYPLFKFLSFNLKWITLDFVVISVRRDDNIVKSIYDALNKGNAYYKNDNYLLLLLCEDSRHIIELNRILLDNKIFTCDRIYYSTDREANINALSALYVCDDNDFNTINSVNFSLD